MAPGAFRDMMREFVVKFVVTRNSQFASSIWRVWKGRSSGDIYLAPRNIAGHLKVSLHESGMCRVAQTSQSAKRSGVSRRVYAQWMRPELQKERISVPVTIVIAAEFLQEYPLVGNTDATLLDAPAVGTAYAFHLIFFRMPPNDLFRSLPDVRVFGHTKVSDDEYFSVISTIVPFDVEKFADAFKEAGKIESAVLTDQLGPGLRVAAWNDPVETGVLQIADVGIGFIRLCNRSS